MAAFALGPAALALPGALGLAYLLVREPLAIFVGFLYVGVFKDEPLVESLPFDATLGLGLLLICVCTYRVLTGRVRRPPLPFALLLGLFVVAMALGLLSTPVSDYGQDKFVKFMTFTLVAAFSPFALVENRRDLRRLFAIIGIAAVAGGLFAITVGTTAETDQTGDRLVVGGARNTIYTSRFLMTGALILLLAPALRIWGGHRLLIPLTGAGLVAIAASIGSRGPLLALALAVGCTVAAVVLREPRRLLPMMLIVAAGVAMLPFIPLPETSRERLVGFSQHPVEALREDVREPLYEQAIDLAVANPLLGVGTGGFALYSGVLTSQNEKYPHNVFLEAGAELGLGPPLALAVVTWMLLAALYRKAWEAPDEARYMICLVGGIFLLNFFATQFSGDFNDNRTFWATFGLAWLVARYGVPLKPGAPAADQAK